MNLMPNVSQIKSHPQYEQIKLDLLRAAISQTKHNTFEAIAKRYKIGTTTNAGVMALKRFKKNDLFQAVAAVKVAAKEMTKVNPAADVDDMLTSMFDQGRFAITEAVKAQRFGDVAGIMEQSLDAVAKVARNRGKSIDPAPVGITDNGHLIKGQTINVGNFLTSPKIGGGRVVLPGRDGPIEDVTMNDDIPTVEVLPEGLSLMPE